MFPLRSANTQLAVKLLWTKKVVISWRWKTHSISSNRYMRRRRTTASAKWAAVPYLAYQERQAMLLVLSRTLTIAMRYSTSCRVLMRKWFAELVTTQTSCSAAIAGISTAESRWTTFVQGRLCQTKGAQWVKWQACCQQLKGSPFSKAPLSWKKTLVASKTLARCWRLFLCLSLSPTN